MTDTFVNIKKKFFWADIVYVGGGNTKSMLNKWAYKKIEKNFVDFFRNEKLLSGISAGAKCWFKYILLEDKKNKTFELIENSKMAFLDGLFIPHFKLEQDKYLIDAIFSISPNFSRPIFAVTDCCALYFSKNNSISVLKSKKEAKAFIIDKKNGQINYKELI